MEQIDIFQNVFSNSKIEVKAEILSIKQSICAQEKINLLIKEGFILNVAFFNRYTFVPHILRNI